jgi:hypothetical protein
MIEFKTYHDFEKYAFNVWYGFSVKYNNSYIFSDKYYDINKDIIGIKFSIYN